MSEKIIDKGYISTAPEDLKSFLTQGEELRALEVEIYPDQRLLAYKKAIFRAYLTEEFGAEFIRKEPILIPKIDDQRIVDLFGGKYTSVKVGLEAIADYVSFRNAKHGQPFFEEVPKENEYGKVGKSKWADKARDEFGKFCFIEVYEKNQFRTHQMGVVDLAIQSLSRKLKSEDHKEIFNKILGKIRDRIRGSSDGTIKPYIKLDKQGKLEVVEFIETTCLDLLRFFSGEINAGDLAKPILDGSALSV